MASLSREKIAEIRELRAQGTAPAYIADSLKITLGTVHIVLANEPRRWKRGIESSGPAHRAIRSA